MNTVKEKEENFHKGRVAFLIINNNILFLENSSLSHYDWAKSLGQDKFDIKNFNNITRGYFLGNNIYFYAGNFDVNENVIKDAKNYYKIICDKYNISSPNVYAGMNIGEVGTVWKPKVKII